MHHNHIKNYWFTPECKLVLVKEHYDFIKKIFKTNTEKKETLFDSLSKLGYIRIVVLKNEMLICYNENIDLNYKNLKVLKDYCIENNLKLLKESKNKREFKAINI